MCSTITTAFGAIRQRRAGHDFATCSRSDGHTRGLAGSRLAEDFKDGWDFREIFEANSKAIANGFVESGVVRIRINIFAENSAGAPFQRNSLGRHSIRAAFVSRGRSVTSRARSMEITVSNISPDSETWNVRSCLLNCKIDRPGVIDFQGERRPALRDVDVRRGDRDS